MISYEKVMLVLSISTKEQKMIPKTFILAPPQNFSLSFKSCALAKRDLIDDEMKCFDVLFIPFEMLVSYFRVSLKSSLICRSPYFKGYFNGSIPHFKDPS